MLIGGLQKISMIDYPGKLSAIIFTKGCNFLCPFCHNKTLLTSDGETDYTEESVIEFLSSRQGILDAVTITGGEPLLQQDIEPFLQKLREMDFLVKLDTNGYSPEKLEKVLPYLDYIAMDLKAPITKYDLLAGQKIDTTKINKSVTIIKNFSGEKEFRTTLVHPLLDVDDIKQIYEENQLGDIPYFLQNYRPIDDYTEQEMWSFSKEELEKIAKEIPCQIRSSN